jgi:hypothetical protein
VSGSVDGAPRFDGVDWAYQSGRFLALDHDFGVRAMDPAIGRYVDRVFGALAAPGQPARWYSFVDRGPGTDERYSLVFDREHALLSASPLSTMSRLLWHVNRQAVASCSDRVVVHAAAAEHEGQALLLPAPMEAGKTTLVAGLVRDGMRYLTDEAAAIDPASLRIEGLAKPLTIDAGSWSVLTELEPVVEPAARAYVDGQWHVDVRTIRHDALASTAAPGYVIVSRYARGATTELAGLSKPEALVALCENAFNLTLLGQSGLNALAEVVHRSSCHRMVVGDLRAACRLIRALVVDHDHSVEGRRSTTTVREVGESPEAARIQTMHGSFVPMPRESTASVEIDGETVMVDGVTGAVHHLDALGTLIWACFDGSASIDELVTRLSGAFGATPECVRQDVCEFVRRLGERGLLESQPHQRAGTA